MKIERFLFQPLNGEPLNREPEYVNLSSHKWGKMEYVAPRHGAATKGGQSIFTTDATDLHG